MKIFREHWLRFAQDFLGSVLIWLPVIVVSLNTLRTMPHWVSAAAYDEGIDFHAYWYSGHFVREGIDPWRAFFDGAEPTLPVVYLDVVEYNRVAQAGFSTTPANTAPLVLLLSVFSYFSWPTARFLFGLINTAVVFVIPFLAVRLAVTWGLPLSRLQTIIVVLIFPSFHGTSIALANGQTTLLVLFLMFGILLLEETRPVASGLLLGIALSKYSLSLPVFLLLLYHRKFKIIAIGIATQATGLLAISIISASSPVQIFLENVRMFQSHWEERGMNLASLFAPGSSWGLLATIGFTLVVFGLLYRNGFIVIQSRSRQIGKADSFFLMTVLSLWALLAGYHSFYDIPLAILFFVLLIRELDLFHFELGKLVPSLLFAFFVLTMSFIRSIDNLASRVFSLNGDLPMIIARISFFSTFILILMVGMSFWIRKSSLIERNGT